PWGWCGLTGCKEPRQPKGPAGLRCSGGGFDPPLPGLAVGGGPCGGVGQGTGDGRLLGPHEPVARELEQELGNFGGLGGGHGAAVSRVAQQQDDRTAFVTREAALGVSGEGGQGLQGVAVFAEEVGAVAGDDVGHGGHPLLCWSWRRVSARRAAAASASWRAAAARAAAAAASW